MVIMDVNMPIMNGIEASKKIGQLIDEKKVDDCLIVGNSGYADDRT